MAVKGINGLYRNGGRSEPMIQVMITTSSDNKTVFNHCAIGRPPLKDNNNPARV